MQLRNAQSFRAVTILHALEAPRAIDFVLHVAKQFLLDDPASFPAYVSILNCCHDEHSSNQKLGRFLRRQYAAHNSLGTAALALAMFNLCQAHQVALASRCQLASLARGGKAFLSGLMGFAHIFGASSYFFRIWGAAVRVIHMVRVQQVREVAPRFVDNDHATQGKVSLLRFLMQAQLQRHVLSTKAIMFSKWVRL